MQKKVAKNAAQDGPLLRRQMRFSEGLEERENKRQEVKAQRSRQADGEVPVPRVRSKKVRQVLDEVELQEPPGREVDLARH